MVIEDCGDYKIVLSDSMQMGSRKIKHLKLPYNTTEIATKYYSLITNFFETPLSISDDAIINGDDNDVSRHIAMIYDNENDKVLIANVSDVVYREWENKVYVSPFFGFENTDVSFKRDHKICRTNIRSSLANGSKKRGLILKSLTYNWIGLYSDNLSASLIEPQPGGRCTRCNVYNEYAEGDHLCYDCKTRFSRFE